MTDVLLVSDVYDTEMEYFLNGVYLKENEIPFDFKEVESIAEAIDELKRRDYKLIITCQFPPDDWPPGTTVDELISGMRVFRLLEYCDAGCPSAKVCIVSCQLTIPPELEEMYRVYPCVLDVLGQPLIGRKEKRLRKAIQRVLFEPAANGRG
jgi:hypothetical protein